MAYTLNSAKDSLGNEDQFMAEFNKRAPEIIAYKNAHGGDLEGAFQAVTGKPWPSGRSVKKSGAGFEMTKDRTVKSVLGKYVAPIAGAVAAPFVLPALFGAGGAAAGTGAGASTAAATGAGLSARTLLPQLLDVGGLLAGGLAGGREAGRAAEQDANQTDFDNQSSQYRNALAGTNIDLERRKFQADNYDRQSHNATRGGLLQGLQDVSIQAPAGIQMGTVTGGLRPSAIQGKNEIGAALQRNAMIDLLDPTKVNGGQSLPDMPTAPTYTPGPRATGLDTGLNAANLATSGISLIQDLINKSRRTQPQLPSITAPSGSNPMSGVSFMR